MSDALAVGLEGSATHEITAEMSPPHLPAPVLSTPSMIQLIEATCLSTVQPHLPEGHTTVGTHVCVSHDKAAMAGESVEVSCRLTEIDRRRLTFEISVTCGDRVLSQGTHQRALIDLDRFG
ncbi:MAG: thioesterase family protein, partial [Acidimicrobiales bacterium]